MIVRNVFDWIVLHETSDGFKPRPASQPTTARPGTAEKIAVLAARLEAGEELWHADDATLDGAVGALRPRYKLRGH